MSTQSASNQVDTITTQSSSFETICWLERNTGRNHWSIILNLVRHTQK